MHERVIIRLRSRYKILFHENEDSRLQEDSMVALHLEIYLIRLIYRFLNEYSFLRSYLWFNFSSVINLMFISNV